jgi:hypothetical protein
MHSIRSRRPTFYLTGPAKGPSFDRAPFDRRAPVRPRFDILSPPAGGRARATHAPWAMRRDRDPRRARRQTGRREDAESGPGRDAHGDASRVRVSRCRSGRRRRAFPHSAQTARPHRGPTPQRTDRRGTAPTVRFHSFSKIIFRGGVPAPRRRRCTSGWLAGCARSYAAWVLGVLRGPAVHARFRNLTTFFPGPPHAQTPRAPFADRGGADRATSNNMR